MSAPAPTARPSTEREAEAQEELPGASACVQHLVWQLPHGADDAKYVGLGNTGFSCILLVGSWDPGSPRHTLDTNTPSLVNTP